MAQLQMRPELLQGEQPFMLLDALTDWPALEGGSSAWSIDYFLEQVGGACRGAAASCTVCCDPSISANSGPIFASPLHRQSSLRDASYIYREGCHGRASSVP